MGNNRKNRKLFKIRLKNSLRCFINQKNNGDTRTRLFDVAVGVITKQCKNEKKGQGERHIFVGDEDITVFEKNRGKYNIKIT